MPRKEKGASPYRAAPQQHQNLSYRSTSRLIAQKPPGGVQCVICNAPVDVTRTTGALFHRVESVAPGAWLAVAVCPACRATYAGYLPLLFAAVSSHPRTTVVKLKRGKIRRTRGAKRLPPYARAIADNPPLPETVLYAVLDWGAWQAAPRPAFVLPAEQAPAAWDLRFVAGRRVRVLHGHQADPDRLFQIAQALVDAGAASVEMRIHPAPRGASLPDVAIRFQAEEDQ